jgi:hypothetical protein
MVVVGYPHTHYLGNVVTDFVATVRELVCRLLLVLASGTAPHILLVCIGHFHQHLEVLLGKHVVGLDGGVCYSQSSILFLVKWLLPYISSK